MPGISKASWMGETLCLVLEERVVLQGEETVWAKSL